MAKCPKCGETIEANEAISVIDVEIQKDKPTKQRTTYYEEQKRPKQPCASCGLPATNEHVLTDEMWICKRCASNIQKGEF